MWTASRFSRWESLRLPASFMAGGRVSRNEVERMNIPVMPRRSRGHDEDRADVRLGGGGQWVDDQELHPWRGSAARFVPVAALALVLIAACASAFSMLIWEPDAEPPAPVTSIVDSSQAGRVLPAKARRVRNSAGDWKRKSLCSLNRLQKNPPLSERTSYHRRNPRPPLLS